MEPTNIGQSLETIGNYAEMVGCSYGVCLAVGSGLVGCLGKTRVSAVYFGLGILIALCGLFAPGLIFSIQQSLSDARKDVTFLATVSAALTALFQSGLTLLPIVISVKKNNQQKLVTLLSLSGAALLLLLQSLTDITEVQLALPLPWAFSLYFAHKESNTATKAKQSKISE